MNKDAIIVLYHGEEIVVMQEVAENLDISASQEITDEEYQQFCRAHLFLALCEQLDRAEVSGDQSNYGIQG